MTEINGVFVPSFEEMKRDCALREHTLIEGRDPLDDVPWYYAHWTVLDRDTWDHECIDLRDGDTLATVDAWRRALPGHGDTKPGLRAVG